jgi:hypothetical protein
MRRMLVFMMVLLATVLLATAASADGNSKVVYTWTVSDLGQGGWGGGPLYADGSTGGNFAFSLDDGQEIFHLHPTSWSEVVPGEVVDICFTLHQIKGPQMAPSSFCLSDMGIVLPVTGTPIIIPNPDLPDTQTLIRVTPAN